MAIVEVSVIVCTYNRADLLKGCLESLVQQTLPKEQFEILVIDNASTDSTRELVESFLNIENIRYIFEDAPGLSHARNRGMREARGEYLAYIDDDARAAADWLEVAERLIRSVQPRIDCLGGPYHPFYTSPKPDWFKDEYEVRGFGNQPRQLGRKEYISGANMIWAKDSLEMIGGFNVRLGVIGNQLVLGEETFAFEQVWQQKETPVFYYSPAVMIYHWVPDFKMTVSYLLRRKFAAGQYQGGQGKQNNAISNLRVIGQQLFKLFKAVLRFFLSVRQYSHWQNWVSEAGGRIAFYWGDILGRLEIRPKISQGGRK